MRRVLAAVVIALIAVPLAGAAAADRPGQPPLGKVLLGMVGPDPAGFDALTGKHHALHLVFGGFRDPARAAQLVENEWASNRLPILSLASTVAPADIAAGAEDAWLVPLARALNETDLPVWVRPLPEMNGAWNPWCAYNENGTLRGPKHSTAQFVRAFRRIVILMRGGSAAAIDRRLAAEKLPAMRVKNDISASGAISIIWNPQGHGTPYIEANGPRPYWPGGGFVDFVANDLYSDSGEPSWRGMDTLYDYGKPFLVAEWALEAEDDPAWAQRMFDWIAKHPRTIGLVYFDKGWSRGSGIYRLQPKARSLSVYRRAIKHPRFLAAPPRR